jgi:hypothetical protein
MRQRDRFDPGMLEESMERVHVPPAVATDRAAVARLQTEERLARAMGHPNV